jgi:hypothetical protein
MKQIDTTNNQLTTKLSSIKKEKPMLHLREVFKLTFIALFSVVILASCSDINSGIDEEEPKETEITAEQMRNSESPYDEEGAMHNKFLDYFVEATAEDTAITQERAAIVIEEFYADNDMEFTGEHMQGYGQLFEAYTELGMGSPRMIFPSPTDELCRWFPVLCDIFNPTGPFIPFALQTDILNGENGGTSTERTLRFIETTKKQEAQVMASSELGDEHKNALLAQYAVARYSAAYWHNAEFIQQEKNGYYDSIIDADSDGDAVELACNTCDVVGADAGGAAVGALIGGPVGAGVGAGVASAAAIIEIWFW